MPPIDPTLVGTGMGIAFGSALPWPFKAIWRFLRGTSEREAAAAENTANREAAASEAAAERDGDMIQRLLDRAHDVESMLEVLRRALDKNLVRENSVVTAAELLLGIVELIEKPTPAMMNMRFRAIEILALARRINGG